MVRYIDSRCDSASSPLPGKPVDLLPEAEEVAGFYGALLDTDHAKDLVFNKNFFDDFKKILEKYEPVCTLHSLRHIPF